MVLLQVGAWKKTFHTLNRMLVFFVCVCVVKNEVNELVTYLTQRGRLFRPVASRRLRRPFYSTFIWFLFFWFFSFWNLFLRVTCGGRANEKEKKPRKRRLTRQVLLCMRKLEWIHLKKKMNWSLLNGRGEMTFNDCDEPYWRRIRQLPSKPKRANIQTTNYDYIDGLRQQNSVSLR